MLEYTVRDPIGNQYGEKFGSRIGDDLDAAVQLAQSMVRAGGRYLGDAEKRLGWTDLAAAHVTITKEHRDHFLGVAYRLRQALPGGDEEHVADFIVPAWGVAEVVPPDSAAGGRFVVRSVNLSLGKYTAPVHPYYAGVVKALRRLIKAYERNQAPASLTVRLDEYVDKEIFWVGYDCQSAWPACLYPHFRHMPHGMRSDPKAERIVWT